MVLNVLLSLLVGILTSAIIAYITASLLLALRQIVAATRLQAYLMHWQNWVIENKFFSVFNEGKEWNTQIKEIRRRSGDAMELFKLQNEKRELYFDKTKAKIAEEGFPLDRELILTELRKLPKDIATGIVDWSDTTRQNIIEGKTFISDDEAVALGIGMAQQIIGLKMCMLALIDGVTTLLLSALASPENFDFK